MPAWTKKLSRLSSKITRTLKRTSKSCKTSLEKLFSLLSQNKISTLHTTLLIWLVIRVEDLHGYLKMAATILYVSASLLQGEISDAREEFRAAVESILTLFGGDDA